MSTRSGKRIHTYINDDENTENDDVGLTQKNEVKSRKKKKEKNALVVKKRNNYVSYPTENDGIDAYASSDIAEGLKPLKSRKLPRSTLKEVNVLPVEITSPIDNKKRLTRRTKKFAENGDVSEHDDTAIPDKAPHTEVRNKKKKRAKMEIENDKQDAVVVPNKKKSKKKKGRKGKKESPEKQNKSTTSVDSFHSAIDSPQNKNDLPKTSSSKKQNSKLSVHLDEIFEKQDEHNKSSVLDKSNKSVLNDTVEKSNKKSKSSNKRATYEMASTSIEGPPVSITVSDVDQATVLNNTLEKKSKKKMTSLLTVTDNKDSASINDPIVLNSTFDKGNNSAMSEKLNTTFDGVKTRKSIRNSNSVTETLNSTYDKTTKEDPKTISLNSTYDTDSNPKLDTTFDKLASKSGSEKSSLITSDDTVNITFDKSDDNSRISLTSDESKTENIVNTTPVLIESSMDESRMSEKSQDKSTLKDTSLQTEAPQNNTLNVVPLTREGTFTKEGPEIKTPTKRMTLPTPGSTPYHSNRVSQKKSVLNVTRSIDKSRRSSLADLAPRQTRVMFCSPMNSPTVETQNKKKIIKSSLKGSNKSFVFNDTAQALPRPNARKRSYTHNDADAARAKRSRLADDLQQSVDRLSRPRTVSAVVKPSAPITPTKKPVAPTAKPASRTKLPNFAALHQKQFDRMESLDECQQRKMTRAKQLLTPNGGMQVLGISSPRDTPPTAAKETPKVAKPVDSTNKPLPTLESLRPGYTRFGFKMNIGVNPFGSSSKVAKPVEKPGGLKRQATFTVVQRNVLKRQATLPANQSNGLKRQATLPANQSNGLERQATLPANQSNGLKRQATLPANQSNGLERQATLPANQSNGLERQATLPANQSNGLERQATLPANQSNGLEIQATLPANQSNGLERQATLPSVIAATTSRMEVAKQAVMREKSSSLAEKRKEKREDARTVIKGVRTNRRFELQMKHRNGN